LIPTSKKARMEATKLSPEEYASLQLVKVNAFLSEADRQRAKHMAIELSTTVAVIYGWLIHLQLDAFNERIKLAPDRTTRTK
jgi:hypothetical protein